MVPRCPAVLVRKGINKDELFRRDDLPVDKLAPHFMAVWRSHAVVKEAARAKIGFAAHPGEAFRAPPALQVRGVGPRLEHELTRRIKNATDNAGPLGRSDDRTVRLCQVFRQNLQGLLSALDRKSTRLNSSHLVISYAVF